MLRTTDGETMRPLACVKPAAGSVAFVYRALIESAALLRSPPGAAGTFGRETFVPIAVGSPAAVFFLGIRVPAAGEAEGEVNLTPSLPIGVRPCAAIPARAAS